MNGIDPDRRILRGATIVLCVSGLIRLAGLAKELAVAATFGRGDALEMFLLALVIPATLANLISLPLHQALLPIHIRRRRTDPVAADRLCNRVMAMGVITLVVLGTTAVLGAGTLVPLLAPGFAAEKAAATVALVPLLMPLGVLSGTAILLSVPLHARERFGVTTLAPVATPLATLTCLAITGWSGTAGPLVAGALIGGVIEILILLVALVRTGHDPALRMPAGDTGDTTAVFRQTRPLFLGMSCQSAITVAESTIAATLAAGSLAGLAYAQRLIMMPVSLVTTALGTVCFPVLSDELTARGPIALSRVYWRWQRRIICMGALITVVLAGTADALVAVLYRRGAFDRQDAETVASLLRIYAFLLPVYVSGVVSARTLNVLQRNAFLGWISLSNLVLTVGLNLILLPHFGLQAIPITAVVVYASSAIANCVGVGCATRPSRNGG